MGIPPIGRWFGKPGKAGKQQSNVNVPGNPSGPQSGSNVQEAAPFRFGTQPIPLSMAQRLFYATTLVSPMVRGRFRPQDRGSAPRRAGGLSSFGTPDLGALQGFRGSFAGPRSVRLGAQAGPSDQPAFPATNNDSLVDLAGLGLPDVWRVNRL